MALTPRKPRPKRGKPLSILDWDGGPLDRFASEAEYLGSSEHKEYVNPVSGEPPHPRAESDCSRCEKYPKEEWVEFTDSLRAAIRMGCVASADANGFPRYVWGFHRGKLFQARHRTDPPGTRYKGWWITPEERPSDPGGRLRLLRETLEPPA